MALTSRRLRQTTTRPTAALLKASAGDVTALGVPITQDGIGATFTRASTAFAIDQRGRLYTVPYGQPRLHTLFNSAGVAVSSGLLTGPVQTNLVTNPDSLTSGSGWTITGSVQATDGQGLFAGAAMTLLRNLSTGGAYRSITFTGNGRKVIGLLLKATGTGDSAHTLYDSTAAANRARIVATWTAGVLGSVTASAGTLLSTQRLADGVYFVVFRSTLVTAANNHEIYASDGNGATIAEVLIGGVTVINAEAMATPYGQTVADKLTYPYLAAASNALTVYHDCTSLGFAGVDEATAWQIGVASNALTEPRLSVAVKNLTELDAVYRATPTGTLFRFAAGDLTTAGTFARTGDASFNALLNEATPSALPTYGQRMQSRLTLSALGALTLSRSFAGAAETEVVNRAAAGMPTAWAGSILSLGSDTAGTRQAPLLHHELVVAGEVLTLAQVEALV